MLLYKKLLLMTFGTTLIFLRSAVHLSICFFMLTLKTCTDHRIEVRLSFVLLFVYRRFPSYIICMPFNYRVDINENFENL